MSSIPCRPGCGACCIAPSISSPIPGMPGGKPAGTRCIHLAADSTCAIYEGRPPVCAAFTATEECCGTDRAGALDRLARLEALTAGR